MTTHLRPPHAAEILSLFLASQNLTGLSAPPGLVPPGEAVYNGSEKQEKKRVRSSAMRILMLGNSFTFTNHMPQMLADLTGAEVVHHTSQSVCRVEQYLFGASTTLPFRWSR